MSLQSPLYISATKMCRKDAAQNVNRRIDPHYVQSLSRLGGDLMCAHEGKRRTGKKRRFSGRYSFAGI